MIEAVAPDKIKTGRDPFPRLLAQTRTPREHQLALLVQLSLLASRESDLDRVSRLAAAYLRDALGCDFTKVLDARSSAGGLLVRGGAGWEQGVVGEREVPEGDDSQGGYTLRHGEPVIVDDTQTETRFKTAELLRAHGVRSGISTVIAGDPEPFGVLQADSREPAAFEEADVLVLDAFADVLSGAVARTDREQASDHFASLAAHELRTPLTLIIGYADRLLRELDADGVVTEDHRDEIKTLHGESLRLRHAVDLFLALGDADRRLPRRETRAVDLVEVTEEVVPVVLEHFPQARVRIEPGDQPAEVMTDGHVVARILTVLVENAAKYTHPGSSVLVAVDGGLDGSQVHVADHCGGLADADLRRLFMRSYQGRHGRDERDGLGLGLYIAQRLSEHLGAGLQVRNSGDGCVFSLALPSRPPDE